MSPTRSWATAAGRSLLLRSCQALILLCASLTLSCAKQDPSPLQRELPAFLDRLPNDALMVIGMSSLADWVDLEGPDRKAFLAGMMSDGLGLDGNFVDPDSMRSSGVDPSRPVLIAKVSGDPRDASSPEVAMVQIPVIDVGAVEAAAARAARRKGLLIEARQLGERRGFLAKQWDSAAGVFLDDESFLVVGGEDREGMDSWRRLERLVAGGSSLRRAEPSVVFEALRPNTTLFVWVSPELNEGQELLLTLGRGSGSAVEVAQHTPSDGRVQSEPYDLPDEGYFGSRSLALGLIFSYLD